MSARRLSFSLPSLPTVGLYVSLLVLPGGFIGLLLMWWLKYRSGKYDPKGKAEVWYSQMRRWYDRIPGASRLASNTPRLNLDTVAAAPARRQVDPPGEYLSA